MAVILDDKDYGGTGLGGENKMKYKVSDSFLIPVEITAIDGDRTAPYFLSGCVGTGWWSEAALKDMQQLACDGCKWKEKRHQKCTCCIRNRSRKDNYEEEMQ